MSPCSQERALIDELLVQMTLDDQQLPTSMQQHLYQCTICQERFNNYTRLNTFLHTQLYRSTCPDAMTLSNYCTGLLVGREMLRIAGHLSCCPLCQQESKLFKQVLAEQSEWERVE